MRTLAVLLVCAASVSAQAPAVRAGAKLYARQCAACHGRALEGRGQAPPLATAAIAASPPDKLVGFLRDGSLRRGMPSFAWLPEQQRRQIVAFLRSVRE